VVFRFSPTDAISTSYLLLYNTHERSNYTFSCFLNLQWDPCNNKWYSISYVLSNSQYSSAQLYSISRNMWKPQQTCSIAPVTTVRKFFVLDFPIYLQSVEIHLNTISKWCVGKRGRVEECSVAPLRNKKVKILCACRLWSKVPDWAWHQDILTDWLAVGRNVTLTLTLTLTFAYREKRVQTKEKSKLRLTTKGYKLSYIT
jgi:hypothetical protein